ncbi:hypothetical protein FB451DRAFT_1033290, partial [Mycena latifolia]
MIAAKNAAKRVNPGPDEQSPRISFPPRPPSMADEHRIITNMCEQVDPANFQEAGCAVCGALTPFNQLTLKTDLDLDYSVLNVSGATRKERTSVEAPIEDIEGPVMDDECKHMCVDCEARLLRKLLPLKSLANRIWVGKVPWQLQDLSYAEKMLIAKVRHNRCVVRVASGRGKLSANAIMFANPTVKIYNVLPPTRDELLAFVFLGPTKPTEDEFKRTPMLLNHCDYADLNISPENLADLPENGIPCGVDWKKTEEGQTNKFPGQLSVHDDGEEEGTYSGPCTFAVHGLSGEQYNNIKIDALKAKALDHLANAGKTLGVGHSDEPESTWNNVQLYPQMFPWLFPYGLGVIGHPDHKNRLSEARHKHHLLMYHDKRFQTDLYFPMVAFNDLQIKGGVTGSYLLAKHPAVLTDLARRLSAGENVVPKTEAERTCFDVLKDLDH